MHFQGYQKSVTIGTIVLIIVLSAINYSSSLNEFPAHIHAWSQADRYALAIGFTRNGENFFLPETFNLNPQFPASSPLDNPSGITAVDFPLPDYIASLLMRLLGTTAPWVFRLLTLITGLAGVYLTFRLARKLTGKTALSAAIALFMLASPAYAYYLDGFIPSIYSLSLLLLSWNLFYNYLDNNKLRTFSLSVLFIGLATLIRTSFGVFLLAMLAERLFAQLYGKKKTGRELLILTISIVFVLGYFLYNQHLRTLYGSVFLSRPLPPGSLSELGTHIKSAWTNWQYSYLTHGQYLLLTVLLLIAIINLLREREQTVSRYRPFMFYTLISLFGVLSYSVLMSTQFRQHDYYFLDSFFPQIILIVILLARHSATKSIKLNMIAGIIATALILFSLFECSQTLRERRSTYPGEKVQTTIDSFRGSDRWLDSIGVPGDASILVPGTPSPNIPFILMDRKGYSIMNTTLNSYLDAISDFQFDYLVKEDYFLFEDVLEPYPAFLQNFKLVGCNGKLSIYKYSPCSITPDIEQALQLRDPENFDIPASKEINFDKAFSIAGNERYYDLAGFSPVPVSQFQQVLVLTADWSVDEDHAGEFQVVCTLALEGKTLFYKAIKVDNLDTLPQIRTQYFFLPPTPGIETELKVYIYNYKSSQISCNNLKLNSYYRACTCLQ